MTTLYNVVSSDGFIAYMDGSEDFIPDEVWVDFLELCEKHATLAIGRKTYEAIQQYAPALLQAFEKLKIRKIVVSSDAAYILKPGYEKVSSPQDACMADSDLLLSSGSMLNTSFLKEGLIQKAILNILPFEIGEGITLFDQGIKPQLTLLAESDKPQGRKLRFYKVN